MQSKPSISCPMQTISFSKPKSNGQTYRSISSSTVSLHNDSALAPVQFIKSHVMNGSQPPKSSQSLPMIEFSVNSSFPKSKASFQPLQPLQPLDICLTSMGSDIDKDEASISCISPAFAEPLSLSASISSFKYCNDLNSYLVDSDCLQVMKTLNNILAHYRSDIDFKIDYAQKRIDGLVFVSNYGVYFRIYFWEQPQHKTRIEFRRTSGDALASAKFWSQIQGLYSQNISTKQTDIEYNSFDFIALDNSLDTAHIKRFGKSELDELTQCLIENDVFVVDELNYFYECMLNNKDIAHDILAHKQLMKELISALLNQDVCVSRTALLILRELAAIKQQHMAEDEANLFENINVLLNDQRCFIRSYSIELLYYLTNECWKNMDEMCKRHMIENVRKYESTSNDDSTYKMIHKINEKLMMK